MSLPKNSVATAKAAKTLDFAPEKATVAKSALPVRVVAGGWKRTNLSYVMIAT
jgi:hypothetical protein